jgi:hypothetical protein
MSEETDEIVGSLGRELVSDLAPEELPLYPSLLSQFQDAKRGRGGKSSDDQVLGRAKVRCRAPTGDPVVVSAR